jgi:NAD(P)-dependent dehydrogenase (short-subunit alcohol dehydrogenase family)
MSASEFAVKGFSGVLNQEVSPLGIRVTLAEPGGMRTDWAGSSMEIPPFDPAYEPTVSGLATYLRETTGKEPIDPAKVARVFLDLADNPEPLHLVLGKDAVDYVASAMQAMIAEDQKWAEVSRSVDFD